MKTSIIGNNDFVINEYNWRFAETGYTDSHSFIFQFAVLSFLQALIYDTAFFKGTV